MGPFKEHQRERIPTAFHMIVTDILATYRVIINQDGVPPGVPIIRKNYHVSEISTLILTPSSSR